MRRRKDEALRGEPVVYHGNAKLWMGSILASLVAAISVFAVMMQMEKNMLTQYEKGSTLQAVKEVPKGQLLTLENWEQYFVEVELDKERIADTAVTSVEQIQNLIPIADIDEGTLITTGMFVELDAVTAKMEQPVIAGFRAEDLYQVVGGILRAGDRIHIYCVNEAGETGLVWSKVFVQQVFDQSGMIISNDNEEVAAQRINIFLDYAEVEQFYSELAKGSLRVVKVWD